MCLNDREPALPGLPTEPRSWRGALDGLRHPQPVGEFGAIRLAPPSVASGDLLCILTAESCDQVRCHCLDALQERCPVPRRRLIVLGPLIRPTGLCYRGRLIVAMPA